MDRVPFPLVCFFTLLCIIPASAAGVPWWNDAWQYRLILRVVPQQRRADINTARVDMAEQSEFCAKDGRDVRVVDEQGRILPHAVTSDEGTFRVRFLVRPDAETYYVYYGNPEAPPAVHQWEEKLGGLTLETFALPHRAYNAGQISSLLQQQLQSFGSKQWRQINDLENPFGRNDRYISIYEGTIYCPEDGQYTFALNADDMASFYLQMGQQTLLSCSRNAGVPSEDWQDPQHPQALQTTEDPLQRGVYSIRYYHVENGGAQLAKLGWQKPSSDAVVTVPPRAFVRYLPVDIRGRQKRGQDLNPFFVSRHRYTLLVNDGAGRFPNHRLESRSGDDQQGELSYAWEFGDGTTATGRSVEHEFPQMAPHEVTLTVKDPGGNEASVTRRVRHAREPVKRMALRMEVQFENEMPILPAGGTARLQLFLKNQGTVRRSMSLQTLSARRSDAEKPDLVESRPVEGLPPSSSGADGWKPLRSALTLPGSNLYVTLRVLMHQRPIVEKKLAVLSTDRPLGKLTQDRAHNLRDSAGRLVLLRLADVQLSDVPQRQITTHNSDRVRILLIDERVAGPPDSEGPRGYARMLTGRLTKSYPPLQFVSSRPKLGLEEEYPLIGRFLATYRHALKARPNLVILVGQLESVVDTVPLGAFDSYLVAAVDQILSQTRAHVILVTPPPLPGRPRLSRSYARVTKRIGLRKGLVVTDLYSRLMLTPQWKELFKPYGGRRPSYQLYPNHNGQDLISRELLSSIVARLHEDLSRAARRASLQASGK